MKHLQMILSSFLLSLLVACSKPAPDYSGTWSIDYGNQQRTLTMTKNGDEYHIHDELKKTDEDKIISTGQSSGTVNSEGQLKSGQNDMVNTYILDDSTKQLTIKTYDHQTIILEKK